jgi:hypothetical protein
MAYLGNAPTSVPLTSADITDGIITSAKIADGTIVNADINASAGIVTSKLSGALGITEADQWRITANLTGGSADITSNWERSDSTGFGYIGTGMSQSSGIFTFPSTGYWLVIHNVRAESDGSGVIIQGKISVTTNNSTYSEVSVGIADDRDSSSASNITVFAIVDVTSTSNVKVKFNFYSGITNAFLEGNTDKNMTGAVFIRLGDT